MPTVQFDDEMTAKRFIVELARNQSDEELRKIQRYFKTDAGDYGEGDQFIGVRMGIVFQIAKGFVDMPIGEIEKLMESPVHEVRAGAMSIMDKCARRKRTDESRRKEMFDLYLRRIDRVNNWDLVDLAAPFVIGGYLRDKPRDVLYDLARSSILWERRTAIVAASYFIRNGEVDDAFRIAEILISDDEDLIHKAVGGWLRFAGTKDRQRLLDFLEDHAPSMPNTMLRYSMEHLDADQKSRFRAMKKQSAGARSN